MAIKGRRKLLTSYSPKDMVEFTNVARMVNSVIGTHNLNKSEIDYLVNYHHGIQPILSKVNKVRPEINNIMVVNHAQRVTRTVVGYFLGTPIQYIQKRMDSKDDVDYLNDVLAYEGKEEVDKEIGQFQSICGTAYRIVFTSPDDDDDIPFEMRSLDPATTFVVYESNITRRPVAGVTYVGKYNEDGERTGNIYQIYTKYGMFVTDSDGDGVIDENKPVEMVPYDVGGVPIIEYPNNQWRIGDWELMISVMDKINDLDSGRFDDIEQIIQSLLVFINADIDSDRYDEMREAGIVALKNQTNYKSDVKSISNPLDQSGMNLFSRELEHLLDTLVGIPSRDANSGGGADTGQSVELRDGWFDLELVAKNKESIYKMSEKKTLKIVLTILANNNISNLSILDLDIKFTRNKSHNLLVKTQSYVNLLGTRTISPADSLAIVDLVSDTNEFASRGEKYWDDKDAQAIDTTQTSGGDPTNQSLNGESVEE